MTCLDEQTLLDFLAGRLGGEATARAREHVAQCEVCNAIATELIMGAAAHVRPAPARTAAYELVPGALVAEKYRLVRALGEGGMGVVWEAERGDSRVAVKLLKAFDAAAKRRFLHEIATTSRVSSPGLVRVVEVLEDVEAGCPALVLELLPGESLATRLARDAHLGRGEALSVARHLATTLATVHAAGLVHRDVKPANVFLTGDPSRPVVLLDLGLAKAIDGTAGTRLTETGHAVGTPAYMAPEQLAGEPTVDARADLWALGVVLYESLTGRKPFAGRTAAEILRAAVTVSPDLASLDEALAAILRSLLAPARASRPSSAADLASSLAQVA
jgi:serine/threonine-protein kinase